MTVSEIIPLYLLMPYKLTSIKCCARVSKVDSTCPPRRVSLVGKSESQCCLCLWEGLQEVMI